jgi:hypothetical protein
MLRKSLFERKKREGLEKESAGASTEPRRRTNYKTIEEVITTSSSSLLASSLLASSRPSS